MQNWSAAVGRTYKEPAAAVSASAQRLKRTATAIDSPGDGISATAGALPGESNSVSTGEANKKKAMSQSSSSARVLESFMIHERYGHEYMDVNPITGKPGEFFLASTGRVEQSTAAKAGKAAAAPVSLSTKNDGGAGPSSGASSLGVRPDSAADGPPGAGKSAAGGNGTTGHTKSPKTPNMPKPKRRKSKVAVTPS